MRLTSVCLISLSLAAGLAATACSDAPSAPPQVVTGGDTDRGLVAMEAHGCASCHVIPGVQRSDASWVGPPLTKYARRSFVAGVLANNEENLIRWIMDPKDVDPRTAMPDLGVTELEARDIVAYLYSLR